MNLIELGSLGEFIGSVAVLITLIYLAIQMKQTKHRLEANTTAILGASEVNGNESTMRHLIALYSDESMVDLILRATQSLDDLPPSDYFKFHVFCHAGFQLHQITYLQWKKELLDDEYWSFCIRYFGDQMLAQPGVQHWWKRSREIYTTDYRELVDRLIAAKGWQDASSFLKKPG